MQTIKTIELSGAALDWAVAKCADLPFPFVYDEDRRKVAVSPSTDWAQGGPIIGRERIGIDCDDQGVWFASYDLSAETSWGATGTTPLIAAMRCYVASKLGDTVEVPEEFIK